ncbi:MAG: ABC transporter substrate-binding protein [Chloroflexota bacterium]|jgi:peptide/nickel transport system substrate-binding protein
MPPKPLTAFVLMLIISALLASCNGGVLEPTAALSPEPTMTSLPPTETPVPPRELNICLGQEPLSLYLYAGGGSRAMWNVLEAIYDGPVDYRAYQPQPVILDGLPNLENGGALIESVPVERGAAVLNSLGNPAVLDTGVSVLPAGCRSADCAVRWDGISALQMDRLTLTFRLLPGLRWQDGAPLTAADSLYAFRLAADPSTPVTRRLVERTLDYRALDETSTQWQGLPGYLPDDFATYFWLPLPEHAWGRFSAAELLENEEVNRRPLGWGAYQIESWTPGESIRLVRNPNYFRAAEGLPRFDALTFRFFGQAADNNIAALADGTCDFVDNTVDWEGQLMVLTELEDKAAARIHSAPSAVWEQLAFGISPSAYDGGYNPWGGYRQDIFGDARTRRALAACIDRQALVDRLLYGRSAVPLGFFPPGHPLHFTDLTAQPYDPQQGMRLLDEVGWRDLDGDPATPRQSDGVFNVLNGTPLTLDYQTTPDRLQQMTAERIIENLSECGAQVNLRLVEAGELYAPGAQGALFGRNFDLAQFAWQSGRDTPCFLFSGEQIPRAENGWLGVNVTGWNDATYNGLCAAAQRAAPLEGEAYLQAQRAVQQAFLDNLPALPLYFRLDLTLSRPDLCHYAMDSGARSPLWSLESWDSGEGCP